MVQEEVSAKENAQRKSFDWFWDITTRWYFFPVFYVLLAFITVVSYSFKIGLSVVNSDNTLFNELFRNELMSMHSRFLNLLGTPIYFILHRQYRPVLFLYYSIKISSAVFVIYSAAVIQYFKIKKNKMIKWLVITLLLYILLSFFITELFISFPEYLNELLGT